MIINKEKVNSDYSDILVPTMKGKLQYTLMNDFLAKYSFQNDFFALQGLLAALLRIQPEEITDIAILNPIEPGSTINDRNCILDINLEINNSSKINIEIQSRRQDFWPERSVTYLCRNFDHLKEGEAFSKVKPCVQIGILDNDLFTKDDCRYTDEFFVEYELQSKTRHTGYTGKFQIKMLLLNHLNEALTEDRSSPNGLYYWAKLFKAESWEELMMIAKDNPRMESLVGTVRKLSAEEKISQACESRRRYTQDIATYNEEIHLLNSKLGIVSEKLDQKTVELDQKTVELDQKTVELDQKTVELDQKTVELDQANTENAELREIIRALKKELEEKKG